MKLFLVSALIVILFVVLLVALYLRHQRYKQDVETKTVKVFQFNSQFTNLDDSDAPGSPFSEIIKFNGYELSKGFNGANLLLFSDFSFIDQNLGKVPFRKGQMYFVYGMMGSDYMANKALLASNLNNTGHSNYIPRSFVLDNEEDINQLIQQHDPENSLYMVKKNVQRQEGNLITKDIDFITKQAVSEDYVVCQELLQNPYIVNGRKINMRVYMLVVVRNKKVYFYIYNNGFMYYTPKFFEKGSTERDVNITTGYIDRKVYEDNPLTHADFYEFIGEEQSIIIKQNMVTMFRALKDTYTTILVKENSDIPGIKFNIFGVDVAPDEKLGTMLIEVNKGPDLSYKDERDKEVKLTLVKDGFTLVGLSNHGDPNNFIKI